MKVVNAISFRCINKIDTNHIDDLTSRWKRLALYKHNLSSEVDEFNKNGTLSLKTIKKAKTIDPDEIFEYLNNRIVRANEIIEKNLKPEIYKFYKNIPKENWIQKLDIFKFLGFSN